MDNFDLKKYLSEKQLTSEEDEKTQKGILGRLIDKFKAKSPCHNAPMDAEYNGEYDKNIYTCPVCGKEYI
jgi:hypothetical protein